MPPSDRFAVIGQEHGLEHQQQDNRREREGDQRHERSRSLALIPSRSSLPPTKQLHEKRVFDAHAKIFARLAILRECARQSVLKALRRAGEKHEVQQHIKMEDDENDRRENIKAKQRQ